MGSENGFRIDPLKGDGSAGKRSYLIELQLLLGSKGILTSTL